MFVQSGDFVNAAGMNANAAMTFYGQEKVEYNAQLCLMNMAVHGLTGAIKSGDEANTFYHDAHNLNGRCDYVMANPPFNVDKVKSESCESAGRLPFGLPGINKAKEFGNANYLWISYFYSYLNEHGRAGFVMASSSTDSQGKDKDIRENLVRTGHVDVMISVGNNFFYTKSLPCSLWFFDKDKAEPIQDKVLFIDARNYYTVFDRTLNEWSEWQLKNLNAIVWLYRGEVDKYKRLLNIYYLYITDFLTELGTVFHSMTENKDKLYSDARKAAVQFSDAVSKINQLSDCFSICPLVDCFYAEWDKVMEGVFKSKDTILSLIMKLTASELKSSKNLKQLQKRLKSEMEESKAAVYEQLNAIEEAKWLYEKFGEGEYQDIPGLCKMADLAEIEEKNWSLTPGAYVGVAPISDDDVNFVERMAEIHRELLALQAESNDLMDAISQNLKGMGL